MPSSKKSSTPKKKPAVKELKVIEVKPEDLPVEKKRGGVEPAWNTQDVWPGSASVVSVQKAPNSTTITIVVDKKKPAKK